MVEHEHRESVATFYAPGSWAHRVQLDESIAHHAIVRRLEVGDPVRLTSGDGRRASGRIAELLKQRLIVAVDEGSIEQSERPSRLELLPPVADRDRMLVLAEKAVELGASSWQPVMYSRSRSVSPRGEGETFREKVRQRQVSAMEQCGSAWLPEVHGEVSVDAALTTTAASSGGRLLLDAEGEPLGDVVRSLEGIVSIALGPEGGLEAWERQQFVSAGWRPVSLGANVLRFETAGIASLAIVRSRLR